MPALLLRSVRPVPLAGVPDGVPQDLPVDLRIAYGSRCVGCTRPACA